MSVIKPTIDELLAVTDENRFLLCEIAARRARDINDMMRNQHNRAEQFSDIEDISAFLSDEDGHIPNPLSIAFDELTPKHDDEGNIVARGELSFDAPSLREALGIVDEDDPLFDDLYLDVPEPEEADDDDASESADQEDAASESDELIGSFYAQDVDDQD